MKLDKHYTEPRLVELYDIENPHDIDTDFYIQLAHDLKAKVIVDLGCGTGLLTRQLATKERTVIGVDPAMAMLAYARRQPGAEKVEWIEGYSAALGERDADLAVMTSNVAQVFLDDANWAKTLRDICRTLKVGGHLAFESRNPADKGWERWTPETTFQRIESPSGGVVESWLEVVEVGNGWVRFRGHNFFVEGGETAVVDSTLRFRSHAEIVDSLHEAGFVVEEVFGDWEKRPFTPESRMMIFIARRQ
ncbi:MAG: class I SAM-dependent methyltransferase [Chloroflexota bacterium]